MTAVQIVDARRVGGFARRKAAVRCEGSRFIRSRQVMEVAGDAALYCVVTVVVRITVDDVDEYWRGGMQFEFVGLKILAKDQKSLKIINVFFF